MKEKKLINKDLLILPCDLITDIKLTDFIVQYRLLDPTLLCLLSSYESVKENLVPAKKLIEDDEGSPYHENKIIFTSTNLNLF